ncbi:dynamin family protein [Oryzobacter telluris]|uniref:dynamin family protein n=1 Tax=Oryzobacter telluris TaxID=3149179 RepID=UPI00370D1F43
MADLEVRGVLDELLVGLAEPLRLAVVGRVKAGKSTLVNALIGRRVAPTAAGECTRVVTWYRYGSPDRAEVVLRDGARVPLRLDGRRLPEQLGVPLEDVSRVVVHLQAGALRDLTLIDTPGLATLTEENEAAARAAVLGQECSKYATGDADALLYVVRESERADDIAFLHDFAAASGSLTASAVNTLGVLSQADLFNAQDPMGAAQRTARRIASTSPGQFGGVVAVSGLLAQSARAGQVSETVAAALASLDGVADAILPAWQSLDVSGLDKAAAAQAFSVVGPYGLLRGRGPARQGATSLRRWCEEASGIRDLEEVLEGTMVPRAHLIKASRTLGQLSRLGRRVGCQRVLDLVEEVELDPVMHPIAELRALHDLLGTAPESAQRPRLEALLAGLPAWQVLGLPEAPDRAGSGLAPDAREAASRARADASLAVTPAVAAAATVLARSYQILAHHLEARRGPADPT